MLKRMKRRVGIRIDMTPMVDVAFLLLIFYMTTTQFKPPEKKEIKLPSSHSEIKLPESDLLNITITADDSIFVDYTSKREQVINGKKQSVMDRTYHEATAQNIAQVINTIRVEVPGGYSMKLVIKADKNVKYGTMADLMDALQDMKINRFHLITELKLDQG